jgi:hypothetical protein
MFQQSILAISAELLNQICKKYVGSKQDFVEE